MKILFGDFNEEVGREHILRPTIPLPDQKMKLPTVQRYYNAELVEYVLLDF
jgi:hypothetical protein